MIKADMLLHNKSCSYASSENICPICPLYLIYWLRKFMCVRSCYCFEVITMSIEVKINIEFIKIVEIN
jgi:hypothetical protein